MPTEQIITAPQRPFINADDPGYPSATLANDFKSVTQPQLALRDNRHLSKNPLIYGGSSYRLPIIQAKKKNHPYEFIGPERFLRPVKFESLTQIWEKSEPFNHIVIDDFLAEATASRVAAEFPEFSWDGWYVYDNAIEVKKAMNSWDRFGPETYSLLWFLNSEIFIRRLEQLTSCRLYPDFGLNGGGLHTHRSGGKLNTHLDYSIHPKLGLERRLNLIIYLTPDWQEEWGGELGLWRHEEKTGKPGALCSKITPKFNRAVLFDTTQNSWHGLPEPISCPTSINRNSMAVYYLCDPRPSASRRSRAMFTPYGDQASDPKVLDLIKRRSEVMTSKSTYTEKI